MSAWPKRSRPGDPGTSSTTRSAIASSSSVQQLVARELAEPRERVEPELPAHHGRGDEQVAAGLREPRHALADHGPDSRRDAQVRVRVGDAALGIQEAHDLRHEERIPFGLGVDRLDQLGRGLGPGRELDVLPHVGLAQARRAPI